MAKMTEEKDFYKERELNETEHQILESFFAKIDPSLHNNTNLKLLKVIIWLKRKVDFPIPPVSFKDRLYSWMEEFQTKPEKNYRADIEGFFSSISLLLGEIPLPPLFYANLKPENISLVLLDRKKSKFLVKASMGLEEDLVKKAEFLPSSQLISLLKKQGTQGTCLTKDNLSWLMSITGGKPQQDAHSEIETIKRQMSSLRIEACAPIHYAYNLIGFLSIGKRVIGKYSQEMLANFSSSALHISVNLMRNSNETLGPILKEMKEEKEILDKLQEDALVLKAENIISGVDKRVQERCLKFKKSWSFFDAEIHGGGLSPQTKNSLQKEYGLDIPTGFKLDLGHNERVQIYILTLLNEQIPFLSDSEAQMLTQHYANNENILFLFKHQTEWFDGTGYPDGLKSEQIPLPSRIIAVAEAFDIFHQCWKDVNKALEAISTLSGSKFDPVIVETLKKVCASGGIP